MKFLFQPSGLSREGNMGVQNELLLKKVKFSGSLHYTICSFLTFLCQTNFLDSKTQPQDRPTGFSKVLNNPNFSFTGIRINCSAFSLLWYSYLYWIKIDGSVQDCVNYLRLDLSFLAFYFFSP